MKKSIFTIVSIIIIALSFIITMILPPTGKMVLLDEICGMIPALVITIWLLKLIITSWKTEKKKNIIALILIMLLFLSTSILNTKDIILDCANGPKTINLSKCSVQNIGTASGTINMKFYLLGEDIEGNTYRFNISKNDYTQLKNASSINIKCYSHTGRIITYS